MVTFDGKELAAALKAAKAAQRSMGRHNMLKGTVRLWANPLEGGIEFYAGDDSIVRLKLSGIGLPPPGARDINACVSVDAILPHLGKGSTLTVMAEVVTIGAATVPIMAGDSIPSFPVRPSTVEGQVGASVDALAWTAKACGADDSRPVLTYVWARPNGLESADGFRLHRASAYVDLAGVDPMGISSVSVGIIDRLAKASKASMVTLVFSASCTSAPSVMSCVELGLEVYHRSPVGNPPDFGRVASIGASDLVLMDGQNVAEFSAALATCKPVAKDSAYIVRLEVFNDGTALLESKSDGLGSSRVVLDRTGGTVESKVAFSCVYMADALDGMREAVTVRNGSDSKPIHITDGSRLAVVMPMHIAR